MQKNTWLNAMAGFWLVFLFFGIVVALSYQDVSALVAASEERQNEVEALAAIESLSSSLDTVDAERAAYVATGQDIHLNSYYVASAKVDRAIGGVRTAVRDSAPFRTQLAIVESGIAQQRQPDEMVLDAYKHNARFAADALVRTAAQNNTRNEIRRAISEMSDAQVRMLRESHTTLNTSIRNARINVSVGSVAGMIVVVLSLVLSRRELTRRQLAEEKVNVLSASLQQTTDMVVITNARDEIEYVNRATEKTTGQSAAKLVGKSRESLKAAGGDPLFNGLPETWPASGAVQAVVDKKKKNGETVSLQETITPIVAKDGSITHVICTGKDITRQKSLEVEVDQVTNYDVLTGLPKRHVFIGRLGQEIRRLRKKSETIAVLVLDVDRFKLINDVFGFEAGDEILKEVAARLRDSLGDDTLVARIGSDEFGAIAGRFPNAAEVMPAMDKLLKHISRPMRVRDEDYFVTLTAGIALCPEQGRDAATLVRNADIALEQAKLRGRNNYQFYSRDLSAKASEQLSIENRLFTALNDREYLVAYQPYFALDTINIAGAEALIKWKRDKLGFVAPSEFVPTLEHSGLIIDVGEWVLRTACQQLQDWGSNSALFPVSVNLSGTQFRHKHLAEMVNGAVKDFRLDPTLLTLEVTESIFIHDLDFASGVLKKLKDIGISISVDDFGTGYSSLSYLKKLPVDNIKIDKSFVKDVATDPDSTSIVTSIIAMARSLSLKTIAEGIETEDQWKVLRLLRCDMGQGFYFSPALSPEEMGKYS